MNSIKTLLNIEWKIKNVTEESLKDLNTVSSNYFDIPIDNKITEWYLKANIKDSKLGVFLHLMIQYPKVTGYLAEIEFFIRTLHNGKDKIRHYTKECSSFEKGYGWSSLISTATLFRNSAKYLKNGTLTIGAKIAISKASTEEPDHIEVPVISRHQAIFKDYFNTKALSDLTFICSDNVEIRAHRFAVAASSPIWMKMIENVPNIKIEVGDIDSATMTEIMRYIYTEEVNDIDNMAPKLLYGAQKYELSNLKEFCEAAILKNLSIKNAVDLFLLADQHGYKDLLERCIKFIKINHEAMIKDKSWDKLDKKHLNTLLGYYQQNPEYILFLESTFNNY